MLCNLIVKTKLKYANIKNWLNYRLFVFGKKLKNMKNKSCKMVRLTKVRLTIHLTLPRGSSKKVLRMDHNGMEICHMSILTLPSDYMTSL